HLRQLAIHVAEPALVRNVNPHHGVFGNATEHGFGLLKIVAVFLDALDQRAYAPRRLVERLRQLADLVLRGHLKAGVVIATRQLDAMSRKLAQWYHDLPS